MKHYVDVLMLSEDVTRDEILGCLVIVLIMMYLSEKERSALLLMKIEDDSNYSYTPAGVLLM